MSDRHGWVAPVFGILAACGGTTAPPIEDAGAASSTSSSSGGSTSSSSGGSSTSSSSSSSSGSPALDAGGTDAGPNDPSCPKSVEGKDGTCKVGLKCGYPGGRCSCLGYCGGPPPPPDQDFTHWSCETFKDNGCPADAPEPMSACTIPKTCTYGDCCTQDFACKPAVGWVAEPKKCPP